MANFKELYEAVNNPRKSDVPPALDAYGKLIDKAGAIAKKKVMGALNNALGSPTPVKKSTASSTKSKTTAKKPAATSNRSTKSKTAVKTPTQPKKKTTVPVPKVSTPVQPNPKPATKLPNTTSATKSPAGNVIAATVSAAKEAITLAPIKTPESVDGHKEAYKKGRSDGYKIGQSESKEKIDKLKASSQRNREIAKKCTRVAKAYKVRLAESEKNLEKVQGSLDKHIKGEKTAAAVLGMAVAVLAVSKGIGKLLPSGGKKTEKVQVILQQANDLQKQSEEMVRKDLADNNGEVSPETVKKVRKLGRKADKLVEKAQKVGLSETTGVTEESAEEIYNIMESCDDGLISEEEMDALIFEIL